MEEAFSHIINIGEKISFIIACKNYLILVVSKKTDIPCANCEDVVHSAKFKFTCTAALQALLYCILYCIGCCPYSSFVFYQKRSDQLEARSYLARTEGVLASLCCVSLSPPLRFYSVLLGGGFTFGNIHS